METASDIAFVVAVGIAIISAILWKSHTEDITRRHKQIFGINPPNGATYQEAEARIVIGTLTRMKDTCRNIGDMVSKLVTDNKAELATSDELAAIRRQEAVVISDLAEALRLVERFDKKGEIDIDAFRF